MYKSLVASYTTKTISQMHSIDGNDYVVVENEITTFKGS